MAGLTDAQQKAVDSIEANFAAGDFLLTDLQTHTTPKMVEALPDGAIEVHCHYRSTDPGVRQDQGVPPGLEVHIIEADGTVSESQDFG